jgi:hypothetical protein
VVYIAATAIGTPCNGQADRASSRPAIILNLGRFPALFGYLFLTERLLADIGLCADLWRRGAGTGEKKGR